MRAEIISFCSLMLFFQTLEHIFNKQFEWIIFEKMFVLNTCEIVLNEWILFTYLILLCGTSPTYIPWSRGLWDICIIMNQSHIQPCENERSLVNYTNILGYMWNIFEVTDTTFHKTRTFCSTLEEFCKLQWSIQILVECSSCVYYGRVEGQDIQGPSIPIQGWLNPRTKDKAYQLNITLYIPQVRIYVTSLL